ncbi:phosphatidylglycerophosphatase A [Candidatus Babeliales bacterium]|nr:phosphatidylglycerophosphatase A [Candidatus Babeliales bacterium]
MKILDFLTKFIATLGFVGYLPYAPGTWGSLVVLILIFLLPSISITWSLVGLFALFILGIITSQRAAIILGEKDPSKIVIDEAVGMGISLLLLPKLFGVYFVAFVVFRLFDILKPYPINKLQDFPGGFGIIIDDVLAGFLTFICMQILQLLI